MENEHKADGYAYMDLEQMMKLKFDVRNLSYLPKMPVQTLLTGKHRSKKRGRGLDFEEVRKYVLGDDIRNIDWKVTARTKEPHTKVFTEERERPVFVIVDQSSSMFFGSKKYTKSVIAAQMAGVSAWKVLAVGDRVGGIVFNDEQFQYVRPRRDRRTVQMFLKEIADYNNKLGKQSQAQQNPAMLNRMLRETHQYITHDFLVIVVSDFRHFDDTTLKELIGISRHNDVLLGRPVDPMESNFPMQGVTLTDGDRQIELSADQPKKIDALRNDFQQRLQSVQEKVKAYRINLIDISTEETASSQLRRLLQR